MRHWNRFVAGLVALAGLPFTPAQAADAQDDVYTLATIEAEHAICGFPLSEEQQDVIAQRRDALATRGDVSEADIAAVQAQLSAALQRQKADGLCRPDGAEAQLYKRRLTELGLL